MTAVVQADQPLTIAYPKATTGSTGRTSTLYAYQYTGGPVSTVTQKDESGAQVQQVTPNYGLEGELLSRTGDTEAVSFQYDPAYRLMSLADGKSQTTSFSYTPNGVNSGYLSQIRYPGSDTIQITGYNLAGLPTQRRDGNLAYTNYVYGTPTSGDPGGRLTTIQYPSGSVGLTYDLYGRPSSMTDGTGMTSYHYDDDNNLTSADTTISALPAGQQTKTISYAYWPNGSRKTMSTPAGTFSYNYDNAGRMLSLTNCFNESSSWTYLPNNWLSTQTLKNNAVTTYSYNGRGFMKDLTTKIGSTILSEFGSAPNALDNPSSDPQGSVAQRLDGAAAMLTSTMFDAYGVGYFTGQTSTEPWGYGAQQGYSTDRQAGEAGCCSRTGQPAIACGASAETPRAGSR